MTSSKATKASIEDGVLAHEKELQDLLSRVLEVPMKPYLESLLGYDQSLTRMERRLEKVEEEFPGRIQDGLADVTAMLKSEIRGFESVLDERIDPLKIDLLKEFGLLSGSQAASSQTAADHSLVVGEALGVLQTSVQRLQWIVVALSVLLVLAVALCGWAVYQGA